MGKPYFDKDTEDASVLYNNTNSHHERSLIYEKKIHYAFFKLTQNLIHTYKIRNTDVDDLEHLQHEVIVFLLSKINNFDPSLGKKAYSYFNTIAFRWLVKYNKQNYKKRITSSSIQEISAHDNDYHSSSNLEKLSYETKDIMPHENNLSIFLDKYIEYYNDNISVFHPDEESRKIAQAVLDIFRKREGIDIFHKKALYLYIREIIDAKTTRITNVIKKIYSNFKPEYEFFISNGYTRFD
jgi:hypothetical protein